MNRNAKILIVGAGAAGISAAARLNENGFPNVTILESENRIGGRVHTADFGGKKIELGAQWVHGETNNVIYNLASQHNLLSSSESIKNQNFIFATGPGEIQPKKLLDDLVTIYNKISQEISEDDQVKLGTTYGHYFTERFLQEIKHFPSIPRHKVLEILKWIETYDSYIQGADTWFHISASRLKDYWTCDGNPVLNWRTHGYNTLFNLLTKNFLETQRKLPIIEQIIFNQRVKTIDYSSSKNIKVTTDQGREFIADHVIVTISLGVLKNVYHNLFKPRLPIKKEKSIEGLGIGVVDKITLEFPYRWWPKNKAGFYITWSTKEKKNFQKCHPSDQHWLCDVFAFYEIDFHPHLLTGWIIGPSAKYMETLSDEKVTKDVFLLLRTFFDDIYDIPGPLRMIRSSWYTNPSFRGSYSFQSMESEKLDIYHKDLAEPIQIKNKPILLFAGEATHDHYYSTVHGAIESGYREAERLIELYCHQQNIRLSSNL